MGITLLLNAFSKEGKEKLIDYLMTESEYKHTILHHATKAGHEKIVELLLNAFEEKEKLIQYVMKKDGYKNTALHFSAESGNKKIVKLLLDAFGEENNKEKLFEYLMQEDKYKNTALHCASEYENEEILILLLDAFGDKENERERLFEYLMKEDEQKNTALHYASKTGHEKIVKLLLDVFGDNENEKKLIEYVMKENAQKESALFFATQYNKHGRQKIVRLLLNVFGKEEKEKLMEYFRKKYQDKITPEHVVTSPRATIKLLSKDLVNAKILCDLQKVTKMFKKHKMIYKDEKKNLLPSVIFDECCPKGKEKILSFLITDYNREMHTIQAESKRKEKLTMKKYIQNSIWVMVKVLGSLFLIPLKLIWSWLMIFGLFFLGPLKLVWSEIKPIFESFFLANRFRRLF